MAAWLPACLLCWLAGWLAGCLPACLPGRNGGMWASNPPGACQFTKHFHFELSSWSCLVRALTRWPSPRFPRLPASSSVQLRNYFETHTHTLVRLQVFGAHEKRWAACRVRIDRFGGVQKKKKYCTPPNLTVFLLFVANPTRDRRHDVWWLAGRLASS